MDLKKKCIFIITNASRGIGKTVAVESCRRFAPNSLAILLASSETGLEEARNEILALNNDTTVKVHSIDLGVVTSKEYEAILNDVLNGVDATDFEQAFIVHNVVAESDVSKPAKELCKLDVWQKYYHLNVFGVIALNAEFMKRFKDIPKLVVNITSTAGIVPFPSMAEYCSGNAAREMYFRVLSVEEKDTVVLNFSPGPVDTDMTIFIQRALVDGHLKERFIISSEQLTALTKELTVMKLLSVLEEFQFKSGDHVDYYD